MKVSEIRKFKIEKGYVAYSMTAYDTVNIFRGCGLCDECVVFAMNGYYVPILNHYMCKKCFNDWANSCTYYEEDLWFEKKYEKFVEEKIERSENMKLIKG